MTRLSDWQREAHEAKRREIWSLRGPNQIVKVLPAGGISASTLGGYFTIGRFLLNKTPAQIAAALGLPHGYLAGGARIYRFTRLPALSEYEYELIAEFPGGWPTIRLTAILPILREAQRSPSGGSNQELMSQSIR